VGDVELHTSREKIKNFSAACGNVVTPPITKQKEFVTKKGGGTEMALPQDCRRGNVASRGKAVHKLEEEGVGSGGEEKGRYSHLS